jgi:hypothetical protein
MDLYIYYKVKEADAASLQAAVVSMQTTLAQRAGVAGQLKRRPESRDGLQTWMEVYSAAPEQFAAELDNAAAAAGLSRWISGARHSEVFMDITPCA